MTAELAALRRALARTAWRFRTQRALELATWALALACLAGVGVELAGGTPPLAPLLGLTVLGFALGLGWPLSAHRVAAATDCAEGWSGRCTAALDFVQMAKSARTPFMHAAIRDALAHAGRASPSRAAPWRRPRATWGALALVALLAALRSQAPATLPLAEVAAAVSTPRERALSSDDAAAFQSALERLAQRSDDEALHDELARYRALLSALAAGAIDGPEATAQLLTLESKLAAGALPQTTERALLRALAEQLAAARPGPSDTLRAASAGGAGEASAALLKLSEELREALPSERERARLTAALARARERLTRELEAERALEPRLLARKEPAERATPAEKSVLAQKRRELEQLRREREPASAHRRQLERLRRELAEAEQALAGGRHEQASESLANAGETLADRAALSELRQQLAQLREQLQQRHRDQQSAQQQRAQRQQQQQQQQQQQRDEDPKGDSLAQRRERYRLRASGESHDGGAQLALRAGAPDAAARDAGHAERNEGQARAERALELGAGPGSGAELELPGASRRIESSGAGDSPQHEAQRAPASARRGSAYEDEQLAGARSPAPSRSQVIAGAARGGFARASYRKVYADYQAHAEQLLERDEVPPGYRFYVRRYFQLVRPRDGQETP